MPKIAQYQPGQVKEQVVQQPTASAAAPAAAFGTPIAQGISDIVQSGLQLKERVDTTSAEEAALKFEQEKNDLFFNPDSGYFNLQGRDAYDASATTMEAIDKLKQKYGESLNEQAKRMFDGVADQHIARSQVDIQRHASKGLKSWEIGTIEAQVENTLESASLYWNNPDRVREQRALGEEAILDASRLKGLSAEATAENLQTYRSSFAEATIDAAINSSVAEGKEALEEYGNLLEGPSKIKVDKAIERAEKVEKTELTAKQAVIKAGELTAKYDDRQSIIDEVNTIEDPDLRKETMTQAMAQYSRKKQAEKEQAAEFYSQGIDHFNNGGTAEEFKAANPKAWEGMTPSQRNNLLTGKHMITDQIVYHNVMGLPKNQLAKINPTDYADKFNPRDLSRLATAVKQARNGQSITSIQTPSQKVKSIAEQFFGKESTWKKSKTKSAGVQALMSAAQEEVESAEDLKGSKLTPTEVNEVLNRFSREYVVQRSAAGFDILAPDLKINIKTAPPAQVNELSRLVDTYGEERLNEIAKYLEQNDKDVTVETVLNAFRQAVK